MGSDELQRQEIQLESDEELEILRSDVAQNDGVRLEIVERDTRGFASIIIVALIGAPAAVALLGGTLAYIQDRRKGGQLIDLRPGNPLVRRTADVVYGLIIIIAADGKVTVDVKEPKGFFAEVIKEVLAAVQNIATKSIAAIADAAKTAVGDKADVSTEPAAS